MKTNKIKICPYCGETITINAAACPNCGSDEQTGWSEQTYLDGIDVGDDIDYEDTTRKEFSLHERRTSPLCIIIALVLLVLFVVMVLKSIMT